MSEKILLSGEFLTAQQRRVAFEVLGRDYVPSTVFIKLQLPDDAKRKEAATVHIPEGWNGEPFEASFPVPGLRRPGKIVITIPGEAVSAIVQAVQPVWTANKEYHARMSGGNPYKRKYNLDHPSLGWDDDEM
jgi:hypothetical protein